MTDPVTQTHPRDLYTQLRKYASSPGRAQHALEFVRSCTGSTGGFLFLIRAGELALAASTNDVVPAQDLIAEAKRSWYSELERHSDDSKSETLELSMIDALHQAQENPIWRNAQQEPFERRLLSAYRGQTWLPVGMVMLRARDGRSLVPIRQVHVEALCNALLDAGDVPEQTVMAQVQPR